jgi:hypothetical protein
MEVSRSSGRATAFNSRDSELQSAGQADAALRIGLSAEVLFQMRHRCEIAEIVSRRGRCILGIFEFGRIAGGGGDLSTVWLGVLPD